MTLFYIIICITYKKITARYLITSIAYCYYYSTVTEITGIVLDLLQPSTNFSQHAAVPVTARLALLDH